LYIYDISEASWSEKAIYSLNLPNKLPQTGYYDFEKNENVIFYNGNLIYTSEDGTEYSLSSNYLSRSSRIPPDEFYLTCINSDLTEEQQEYLDYFEEEFEEEINDDETKKEISEEYPWMNANRLTNCDKAFMVKEFVEAMELLGSLTF